jgi:chemotaxis protein methyltransferase CheR
MKTERGEAGTSRLIGNDTAPAVLAAPVTPMTGRNFERFSRFIQTECGIKMPDAKRTMLEARLRKRLRILGLQSYDEYAEYVFDSGEGAGEVVNLLDVVTTNKTDFFREVVQFEYLFGVVLPGLWGAGRKTRAPLAAWSAGCSTGEEAWTLGMHLEEFAAAMPGFLYRITATDLSTQVLEIAARGVYREERIAAVPLHWRRKYLLRSRSRRQGIVRVAPELRERVRFARVNFREASYPVPHGLDLIFCRNVLIYFDRDFQHQVLLRLCDHLAPGGHLFLGHTESIQGMVLPVESRGPSIYRKRGER